MTLADAATAGLTALAAALAAGECARQAWRARAAERAMWFWLAAGAALAAGAELLCLRGAWLGVPLTAAAPAAYAAWTILSFAVLPAYLAAWSLRPHAPAGPAVAARVLDTVLLGLLLLAVHFYYLISYRLGGAMRERRLAGTLYILSLSLFASAGLCRLAAAPTRWRRLYGLLAAACLAQGLSEALWTWLRDPAGRWAGSPWQSGLAGLLRMAGCALLLAAARSGSPAGPPPLRPPGDSAGPSVWREVLTPVALFGGLLSIPLWNRLFPGSSTLPIQSQVLAALEALFLLLVFIRQLLVQIQNRTLARDLQKESMRLRLLVDNLYDAVVTEDLDGRIVFANDRFLELFDLPRDQAPGRRLEDFIHPEDRPLPHGPSGRAAAEPALPMRLEFRGLRHDGAVLYLESSRAPVRVGGLLLGFQSVIRDITARRRAEERQRDLVQRLEFFVDNMPLGCIVFDPDFRILEWNKSAERIFGWTSGEAFEHYGLELLYPEDEWPAVLTRWEELLRTKSSSHTQNRNRTKDRGLIECEWFHTSLVDHDGRVVAIASMIQDVTERRNLEAQLRQSQKMEAVGVLAGGIAHDFNNLLTIILGNISLARMRLGAEHRAERGLQDAERAAERAADLVRQLLSFSRKSRTQPRPLNLNDCAAEALTLLRSPLEPRIEMVLRAEPGLWLVEADPGQIAQALINLCVNARDAMPEGGTLTVATANRVVDPPYCRAHPDARPGEFVELSVTDTGHGMDKATLARIFEPFYTTKELGKGTGLGLAIVYGIVQQHHGWITVESQLGRGTTFRIFLPRTLARPEAAPKPVEAAVPGGAATILLVDDEEMILRLGRSILESGGHRVIEARDGEEALAIFRQRRSEIDLVLLDIMMPRKNGRETLAELRRQAPDLPVVLASGYAPVPAGELEAMGARAYIHKPYRPAELARTIREVLDRHPAARE